MKIGILSDTHGRREIALRAAQLLRDRGAEYIIHCGDIGDCNVLDALAGGPAAFVFGNNDFDHDALRVYGKAIDVTCLGEFGVLDLGGKRIAVTHGDNGGVLSRITQADPPYDYLFTGHTHVRHDQRVGKHAGRAALDQSWRVISGFAEVGRGARFGDRYAGLAGRRGLSRGALHSLPMDTPGPLKFHLRSYRSGDLSCCQKLYREGLISGKIAENDSGLDIDDIDMAYMKTEGNHFWVAETEDGKVVGMIGVMLSDGTGEIRRLRVDDAYRRRGIGSSLLEQAVKFCQENNFLKVAIDTFVERESAMKLLAKLHFKHGNTRSYSGKELLVFYLDLYSSDGKDGEK